MTEERITILADEPIAISEVRSPRRGTAPVRFHSNHGAGFYVFAGELTFRFDEGEVPARRDTWVFVPPNVSHSLVAVAADGAHFLELRAQVVGAADPSAVLVRNGATAEAVEVSGNRIAFLADAHETGGAFGVIEFTAPRAFAGPPAHVHRGFHDIVVVLEGTLDVLIGDEREVVGQGAFVLAPPGTAHTFSNPSDAPLRFLNLYVPGGFERFFRERAAATAAGVELTSRYDWERA